MRREAASGPAADAAAAHYEATIQARELGGVPVLDVRPRTWRANEKLLVYIHGGSYTFGSARSTLPSSLPVADRTGLRVISVDYTLAPVGKWEQVTDQAVAVLQGLQGEGHRLQDIALVGDSAGGGLAVGAVLKMRDRGLGMPAAVVVRSPWTDLTEAGDTRVTLAHADPVLVYPGGLKQSAAAYADPPDQRQPYVSPVYADFSGGFPPTLVQGGTKELLLSDFVRLYQALNTAGVPATLDLYEGMPHVFQRPLPDSLEAQAALTEVKRFVDEHLGP
jgi:acetyl esterase/lipase